MSYRFLDENELLGFMQVPHDITIDSVVSTFSHQISFKSLAGYFKFFAGESKDSFASIKHDMDVFWIGSHEKITPLELKKFLTSSANRLHRFELYNRDQFREAESNEENAEEEEKNNGSSNSKKSRKNTTRPITSKDHFVKSIRGKASKEALQMFISYCESDEEISALLENKKSSHELDTSHRSWFKQTVKTVSVCIKTHHSGKTIFFLWID